MKVLVTATTFPRWKDDKIPSFVYDLSLQYKKLGWTVLVLAPHYPGAKFIEKMDGMDIYRFPYFLPTRFERVAYSGGILGNLKRSFLAKVQVPLFFLVDFIYMYFLVLRKKVDVVHSHWIISQGLVGALTSMLTKVKHVCTIHAGDLALLEKMPMSKLISSFVIKHSDRIVFVSNHGLNRTLSICNSKTLKNKSSIIPMGVYIKKNNTKKTNSKKENIILFVGRLSEKKGVPYLLKAFATLNKDLETTRLIIAGDGPDSEDLKKLSETLKISNNVTFTGFITGQEKEKYFNQADILVVPSIETKQGDTEGLPVVILEGMAAGLCVIATNVGGISDVITNGYNGLLIPQKNNEILARKIIQLLKNRSMHQIIIKNALKTANSYDWRLIGAQYSEVLKAHPT